MELQHQYPTNTLTEHFSAVIRLRIHGGKLYSKQGYDSIYFEQAGTFIDIVSNHHHTL